MSPENDGIDYKAELFLYLADRAEHYFKVILPAVEKNMVVLCDRFIDSTYVYQGYAKGLDTDFIKEAHRFIFGDFVPDITFLLDIAPLKGMERIHKDFESGRRNIDESRFDNEKIEFHEKIRNGFLELAKQDKDSRFYIIDASENKEIVSDEIKKILSEKIL